MELKLSKNNVESSYLCKILSKINNYMNITEGKITKELNMNYIERMKGLIISFYDKCLTINKLLLEIKEKKKNLEISKYISILKELSKDENTKIIVNDNENINNINNIEIKNKIKNIIIACNDFLMSFNFKDFILIYYSSDKTKNEEKNKKIKFLETIQSLSFKIDNIVNYFTSINNNFEIYYVIICFIGIKKVAGTIIAYLKNDFKLIKYLYEDKLSHIYNLIDDFISEYNIKDINEEYQEIFFEDQINYVIEKYENENNNISKGKESNLIYQNSKFIQKLFIKEDIKYQENTNNNNKNNEDNNNNNLFNDKIQNIEDNLDDFISNLTSLSKSLSLYNESSPLLFNPLLFQEKDLEILYINLLQFCNICITIFYSITINGLGKSEQDQPEKSKPPPEDGKVYEGGYGMSDGAQGMENITKEIEDEEQLLGLRDENNKNNNEKENNNENENKEDKDDNDNAFEMKNDFKEDFSKEMNDEDENNERKDNSDVEREEDSVNNNDNNKIGDEDIQDDLSEEQKDKKEKKKLDLTDKNIQIEQENKNKNNKYKEGDDEKNNDKNKNVEEDQEQGENENEQNENENKDENKEEDSSENAEKIEKLDVDKDKDKKDKKEKEEKDGNEKEEKDENNMSIEEEIEENDDKQNKENNKKNDINEENNENEEDLMPKNIENDNNSMNDEESNDNINEEEKNENNSSDNENEEKSMKIEEDEDENNKKENAEEKEEKFISNPMGNQEKDLGYNPLTKNKNTQGNNTAKNTKDNLRDLDEEEKNNNLDFEQLEDLDKFKEIFDINSVLNNVYQKGKFDNQKNKNKNKKNEIDLENKNEPIEEINKEDKIMDNDFQFENYEDEKNNDNNNNYNDDDNFEVGYGSNNNKDKFAKEKNKEDKKAKKEQNINKQEIKEKEESKNMDKSDDENKNKREGIKIIEDNTNKEKKERKKSNIDSDDEEKEKKEENDEDISMKEQLNEEEKEENDNKLDNIIEEEDILPKEDNKNDFNENAIINTELKLSENDLDKNSNEKAISLFNDYLDINKKNDKDIINDNNTKISSSLELFFNSLLSSSQNQIIKLTSLLKVILTPNLQSKLIGNYKTGKRLNMKKIISFIASNYRQDKIWLRRTLPYNRDYYITISIDNSLSMKQNNIGYYALQSMLILIKSLQKVGIDNLSLYGITDDCVELYDYNREKNMMDNDKIKKIINYFKFNFESKNSFDYSIRNFLNKSIQNIENNTINDRNKLKYNINFIISDGRFNKNNVKGLTALAKEKGILYVFIIIDRYKFEDKNSILNTMTVKYNDKGDIDIEKYLADFPFQYYTVVQDIQDLPDVLKGILVKWIETIN